MLTQYQIAAYKQELISARDRIDKLFIPEDPAAQPFPIQQQFLADPSLSKLARCGNRAAKTFTTMRDLAWKVTRKHWYLEKWYKDDVEEYMTDGGKLWWVVGPTFDFLKNVCWDTYLKKFIPAWYYTDENFVETVETRKERGVELIDKVKFRNGDVIEFKTYAQALLAMMGRAVDGVYVDEMPPDLHILVELVTRTLDKDGDFILGFTPIVENEDIKRYVDNHERLKVYSWSLRDNPVYRDNPERLARALSEWAHLPEAIRMTRMSGEWYYETKDQRVFENVDPIIVEDFDIPYDWRRFRVADPANHRTGFSEYAEDPETGEWFCYNSMEIEWVGKLMKTEDIEAEIDKQAPYSDYQYDFSIYDNAEAWFGAHAKGKCGKWRPCVKKEKEKLIMITRDCIVTGKVKFFKKGGALAVKQIYMYTRKQDGGIKKKKDHVMDTLQYFCREIPPRIRDKPIDPSIPKQLVQHHLEKLQKKWSKGTEQPKFAGQRKFGAMSMQLRRRAGR